MNPAVICLAQAARTCLKRNPPELPNGAQVALGQFGQVVLAFRGPGVSQPFVTWETDLDGSAYWGHYHATLEAACADYAKRAGRYGRLSVEND